MQTPTSEARNVGRWFVLLGAACGVAATVEALQDGWNLALALSAGFGTAVLAMITLGVGEGFWNGRRLKDMNPPGGGGMTFEGDATIAADQLNDRITREMDAFNERLHGLETDRDIHDGTGGKLDAGTE